MLARLMRAKEVHPNQAMKTGFTNVTCPSGFNLRRKGFTIFTKRTNLAERLIAAGDGTGAGEEEDSRSVKEEVGFSREELAA